MLKMKRLDQPSAYSLELIEKKYPEAVKMLYLPPFDTTGEGITPSYFQRKLRLGYQQAELLMNRLISNGLVETYQTWVGHSVNGVRKSGNEITSYRVIPLVIMLNCKVK
jgi:hypothetical protein